MSETEKGHGPSTQGDAITPPFPASGNTQPALTPSVSGEELSELPEGALAGLSEDEVAKLKQAGLVNQFTPRATRTVWQILRANVFTLFNAILASCIVVTLIFGHWADTVFGIVMVVNALTGIISELKAKRVLEKISILQENPVMVVRSGAEREISPRQIVQGDLLHLRRGDQVPADGTVVATSGLYLDESNLTGESVPRARAKGEEIFSGAAVVAGDGYVKVSAVGSHSWANEMALQVKKFQMAHSELEEGINKILKVITYCLPLVIVLLGAAQIRNLGGLNQVNWGNIGPVVVAAVAGIVGMIPQGLVLLTSINFAAASLKLARQGVLIQELPAVEVLARVDTLCLDKTGTLTTGEIAARGFALPGENKLVSAGDLAAGAPAALQALTRERENDTSAAIYDRIVNDLETMPPALENPLLVPFDSARKWSAVVSGGDTWVLGAPEIILAADGPALEQTATWARQGVRVLALAQAKNQEIDPEHPAI
ncbi:MAG: HAD-IC family P-type ATPase, partial [Varibaculum cambriense]|nr:HAD-IC family P-type ATPase [Varibaculum cambriense]